MKHFFQIYIDGHWKYFQEQGHSHGTLCRWKYTDCTPRPKSLWILCLNVSKLWNVEHHDIILEAIRNVRGEPCQNIINRKLEKKSRKSEKKENQENKP
jgi:hypothetical protein